MALRVSHRYVAEASDREGRRLGALTLSPDFSPAAEWSHLQGVRRGALPAVAHHGPGIVEPVFDEVHGPPYVSGIRVCFDAADSAYKAPVIPWSYFLPSVQAGAARQARDGALRTGDAVVYRICAFPVAEDGATPPPPANPIIPDEAPPPLAVKPAPLASRLARAKRLGRSAWDGADFPLFVHPAVLDEATAMARAAGEWETGGILVGHLRRDSDPPELYAEITAQIPAAHADRGRAHLGFTAYTWSAVSDALALRGRGEIWLGWWHFHPDFCRRCDPARRRRCAFSQPFFSRDDCELHRTVFDTAFSVALLLSDVGEASLRYDWFGWRYGSIAARGCYLLPGDNTTTSKTHAGDGTTPAARVLRVEEKNREH